MTKGKLIKLVNGYLEKVGHGIAFDVISAGVRQEETWWCVPVLATRKGKDVPREVTVNIFANIEDEVERHEHISVLLIPAIPEADVAHSRSK